MKLITPFALIALLPLLSGCFSMGIKQAANRHIVKTPLYDSVDRIEKAAVTKDNQLCMFFEKDLTNSMPSRFTLLIPLAQIRTNDQHLIRLFKSGIIISSTTLDVPGSTIRTNWTLLDKSVHDLKFIPVGAPLIMAKDQNATYFGLDLPLLSNATKTVYLTRTAPIEFTYIDASIDRKMTIITVDPYLISSTHTDRPGYYFWLPLTVPIDIATSPLQAVGYAFAYWLLSGFGNMH